ncbi:hypothetical protein V499_06413 [Pseudogymnoascus sp. VKM F-103]|nr:hypothetical protein V499_06413 [Pseudogymnoascus sp. VKM F-103]
MRVLGFLAPVVAVLFAGVIAQTDPLQVLSQIPACTQECGVKVLIPANCPLTDLANCLCTNTTLQSTFALCVVGSCGLADQAKSSTLMQTEICNGVPKESRSREIIRDVIIISAFTFVIIGLRFYSRALVTSQLWWDDWTIAFAAIIMIPMTVIPIFNATRGFGEHFWDVPPQNLELLEKVLYNSESHSISTNTYLPPVTALLHLPNPLRRRPSPRQILHPLPLPPRLPNPKIPSRRQNLHSLDDLPHPRLRAGGNLAMRARAVGVGPLDQGAVYELAGVRTCHCAPANDGWDYSACITSMIRLKYLVAYGTSVDVTYGAVDVILWSVLEDYVAVICASLMCLRPLIVRCFPSLFPTSNAESKNTQSGWGAARNSKLASKLGVASNKGYELKSEDGDAKGGGGGIRVQKAWATKTSSVGDVEEESEGGESYKIERPRGSEEAWEVRRG